MNILIGLTVIGFGGGLGWYLDVRDITSEPVVYYLIGGLSCILGMSIGFLKESGK